jgi:hypothetical protein
MLQQMAQQKITRLRNYVLHVMQQGDDILPLVGTTNRNVLTFSLAFFFQTAS